MQPGHPYRHRDEYDGSVSIILDGEYCTMMAMSYKGNLNQDAESRLVEAARTNGFDKAVSCLSIQFVPNKYALTAGGDLVVEFSCKPPETAKRSSDMLDMLRDLKIIAQPHITLIPPFKR